MIETPPNPSGRQLSPDGMWEWNGTQWIPTQANAGPLQVREVPMAAEAPKPVQTTPLPAAPARQLSPDGLFEWNGTQWMPNQPPPGAPQVAQSTPVAQAARPPQAPPQVPVKKKGHLVRNLGIVVGALLLIGIGAAIASSGGSKNNATTPASSPAITAAATAKATAPATATAAPSAPARPTLTNQQQNAARAGQQYLSLMAFSRQGLIDQLSSSAGDRYSVQDATIAVDSLNVDWNAQAVKAAKSYLKLMPFSCQGLIDQLDSSAGDKFTVEQATYGAQQAGAC